MALPSVLMICILGFTFASATEKPVTMAEQKCDMGLAHYTELGCKPIFSKKNQRCVERYDCPFTRQAKNPKKCYYKSKEYELRQTIEKSVNDHKCSVECSCIESYDGKSAFSCASVECPENFGSEDGKKSDCIKQYKMDSCCSENEVCDDDEIKALSICTWESKEYKEGERFYPDRTCKECICTKEFDGTLNGTWCQTINCGLELYRSDEIRSSCAPVYLESRECCPIDWKCLEKDDKFEPTASAKSANPDMKCKYGNETMDIGDSVVGQDECVTCSCNVPPMVSCNRALNC